MDASGGESKVDETNETASIGFEVSGVQIAVKVSGRELLSRVRERLPLDARDRRHPAGADAFAIDAVEDGSYRVAEPGEAEPFWSNDLEEAVGVLRRRVLEYVALHAPDQLLVSGAAVALGSQAIVLLGETRPELSALVDALVHDGAVRHADGYVPIDAYGRVHPGVLAPPSAEAPHRLSQLPVPIALIATLVRREAVEPALRDCSLDEGLLAVLGHSRGADLRPEFALGIARMAVQHAALLVGEWDHAEPIAAALIERLARGARQAPPARELPPAMQFATLVLQLEGRLGRLAETLRGAGIDAVLVNGDQVRPALAHRFALSFSAALEVPRSQVPRALGVMESVGWRRVPRAGGARYFDGGVTVRLLPRPRLAFGRQRRAAESTARGRLGFDEPSANVLASKEQVPPARPLPVPLDPRRPLRPGVIAEGATLSTEALTVLDTLRLRTRERDFRGFSVLYGPGVHAFEDVTERLVDAVLARLPDDRSGLRVIEVGTGTGVVALTIARERPDLEVLATDVSLRALGWARRNRRRLGVHNVRLAQGSLLAPAPTAWRGRVAAIVSNLPFALPSAGLELAIKQDWPVGTATGPGADGLGLVRALARDARELLSPGGFLIVGMLPSQGQWIAGYLEELGFEADIPTEGGYINVAARWPGPGD